MVITLNLTHLYKYPIDVVIKTYLKKTDHENQIIPTKVDTISSHQEGEMVCTRRRLTMANYFPHFFRRIEPLKRDTVVVDEEIWVHPEDSKHWIRTFDRTWDEVTIAQLAYISKFEENPKWTLWEQDTVVDLGGFGIFGSVLELFLKKHVNKTMKNEIKLMETLMKSSTEE